jgi:ABC-type Fe3+ transport system permease subunit
MRRVQLIEWGIITIALIFGYKFFEGIFTALVQIFYSFQGMPGDVIGVLLPTVFMITVYAVCFVLLIKRSGSLATYLHGNGEHEPIPVKIGKKALLQVILIGICLVTILTNIPEIILYLFESFKDKVGRHNPIGDNTNTALWHQFKLAAIQVVVAVVAIFFSPDISNWFIRNKEVDELSFESGNENQ